MWKRVAFTRQQRCLFHVSSRRHSSGQREQVENVIEIDTATFYRRFPAATDASDSNPELFPGLSFNLPVSYNSSRSLEYWSVVSPSSLARTTFLQVLAAQHICIPPTARTYPYLSRMSTSPQHAIKYVGFDAERGSGVGGTDVRGAYLSARYESRREETDYCLFDYLTGNTELNAVERKQTVSEKQDLDRVVELLNLRSLLQMPVANLSNGQTRRARIAKALVTRPEVLLLDGPFMGLDPNTKATMNTLLRSVAEDQNPRLIMSLRPEDGVPEWISHLVIVDERLRILQKGPKDRSLPSPPADSGAHLNINPKDLPQGHDADTTIAVSKDGWSQESPALPPGEAVVEMRGVKVSYGDKIVLGGWDQTVDGVDRSGLWWNLHRGQRCGIFGANGSGKTTMLSLITSDHPQTYSLPIKLFGRSRLPGPHEAGISLFDIQRRMGHSSPEVHAFFPKQLTIRRAIESAWADAPLARAMLTARADRRVDGMLRWFARELNPDQSEMTANEKLEDAYKRELGGLEQAREIYDSTMYDDSDISWADEVRFRDLSFSNQRLVLFLRALAARPDLVILDEALSGIDERARDKALLFLSHGEKISEVANGAAQTSVLAQLDKVSFGGLSSNQALLVISHAKEDVPGCLREWICLPEPGEGKTPRSGTLAGPLELNPEGWNAIWGIETQEFSSP